MNRKGFIIAIGVLVLGQILIFNQLQADNIKILTREVERHESKLRELKSERIAYSGQLAALEKMLKSVPPWLLQGFEDPEQGFVEFLDYLSLPEMQAADATVSLGQRSFMRQPVPAHTSRFTFSYSFSQTAEAEKFLDFIISQKRFPVQVTGFSAARRSEGVAGGELSLILLLPPKLDWLDQVIGREKKT